MLAGIYEKYEEEKRKGVRMDRSRVCNSVDCEHRYVWTGPYVALLFFFFFFFFLDVSKKYLISCQKPGMDRNYRLIVFIVYMSYSDT